MLKPNTDERIAEQLTELWHNLYRLHGYVEAAYNPQMGEERPVLLQRADMVLRASRARLESLLTDDKLRLCEPIGGEGWK